MSALTHLTLLHANTKAAAALRFGFEREGAKVVDAEDAEALEQSIDNGSQLIITGGTTKADATRRLAIIEGVLAGVTARVRVLYFGNSISRSEALAAGAHEFLSQPAFIRDVITLSKLMATPMERRTQSISGELSEHFGLFYLVRALGMIEYSGVLSLLRGLRRAELRFYQGEVTSAEMETGSLHGLAALHQSLLWTHGRFDLRDEQTVQRRQIPLERPELLLECERFLDEIRSIAGGLSPSAVLQRASKDKEAAALPSQVAVVLELFDGTISVADVIADSPYRVFETLRIASRLTEQGFVYPSNRDAPKRLMHTALAIDEWLISGAVTPPNTSDGHMPLGPAKGKPASPPTRGRKKQRGRKKKLRSASENGDLRHEKSWSDLLPTAETSLEAVPSVPAAAAAVGEISVKGGAPLASSSLPSSSLPSSRASKVGTEPPELPQRERLEEKGGVQSLAKIFVDESAYDEPSSKQPSEEFSSAVPQVLASTVATAPIPILVNEMREAHAIVAKTASDACMAVQAAREASLLQTGSNQQAPHASHALSVAEANEVTELANAAEAAGVEAAHFSVEEEAFFQRGTQETTTSPPPIENFDDLDDGYELPTSLWQRFMSTPDMRQRKKKKK